MFDDNFLYEDFFAERIASLRVQKKVSAREMSLAIGQNESYINRIENKKAFPSMQVFFYICQYLNISPTEFFNTQVENPEALSKLISELTHLNSKQINALYDFIREMKN